MNIVRDWTKWLKKVSLTNTDENGNRAGSDYNTTDFVYLPSYDDVKDIPYKSRITSLTDFALVNFGWQAGSAEDYQGRRSGASWLRSGYYRVMKDLLTGTARSAMTVFYLSHPRRGSRLCPRSSI